MSGVYDTTVSMVAPLLGLLLVSITSFVQGVSTDTVDVESELVITIALLFLISTVGGGFLLANALLEFLNQNHTKIALIIWLVLTLGSGLLIVCSLIKEVFSLDGYTCF